MKIPEGRFQCAADYIDVMRQACGHLPEWPEMEQRLGTALNSFGTEQIVLLLREIVIQKAETFRRLQHPQQSEQAWPTRTRSH
jgi:hypothetical protein